MSKSQKVGVTVVLAAVVLASITLIKHTDLNPTDKREMQTISCVNNLKQIGISMLIWSSATSNQFPFAVSTNEGGTKELCQWNADGYDSNSAAHFKGLGTDIGSPRVLVCPQDRNKTRAADFATLGPSNVTYRLCTKPETRPDNPNQVLAVCPVDGNTLYCDGRVEARKTNH